MFVSFLRTIILYAALILVIRLMGKRQLGEMEPSEFVVAMVIADLAAVPMQDIGTPLLSGIIPILTVLALELLLSGLSFQFVSFRRILCGKPVILMENGKILYSSLRKTRVNVNELEQHLRSSGVVDLTSVKYAILETNGQISVLPYPQYQPAAAEDAGIKVAKMELPVTVICDGRWLQKNLRLSGKSKQAIMQYLNGQGCCVQEVLLLTVVPSGKFYLARKEQS